MSTASLLRACAEGLTLSIPALLGLAALAASLGLRPFRTARVATGLALALAVAQAACTAALSASASASASAFGAEPGGAAWARIDVVTSTMLLLVTILALTVARYSAVYLAGDGSGPAGERRYVRWLLLTVAAVTALVGADHLVVLALAWTTTSVTLHQLLTFYDRPVAHVAAHKKFLASRLADVCLLGGLALLARAGAGWSLAGLERWGAELGSTGRALPSEAGAAAVLFALAACVKSAQLPLHGWLTQVMEAPTPVSALLHAGVVNLGGLLMIRLAPLMAEAPAAQALLVAVGIATTVLAALVLTTRVSVKVALAWSTCAQMGFMLVQCGLGAWHLALLHLVAHSLYKAHAFLASGGAVDAWRIGGLSRRSSEAPSLPSQAAALALAVGAAGLGLVAYGALAGKLASLDVLFACLLALGLAPMIHAARGRAPVTGRVLLGALGVASLYFGWHAAAGSVLSVPDFPAAAALGWTVVAPGFATLFGLLALVRLRPEGVVARRLHGWLFAGLYLDERFTRWTFLVWPPRLPRPQPASLTPATPTTIREA